MPIFEIKIVCTGVRAFATLFFVSFFLSLFRIVRSHVLILLSFSRYIGWRTQFTSLSRHPCSIQFLTVRVTLVVLCYFVLVSVSLLYLVSLSLSPFLLLLFAERKQISSCFYRRRYCHRHTTDVVVVVVVVDQTPNNYLIGLYGTILSFSSVHSRFLD